MKTFVFDDKELALLNHAVQLLKRDFDYDLVNAAKNQNLELCQQIVDGLSIISLILPKIEI